TSAAPTAKVAAPPHFPAYDPNKLTFREHQEVVAGIRADYLREVNGVRVAAANDARRRMVKEEIPPEVQQYVVAYVVGGKLPPLADRHKFILKKTGLLEWDEVLIWIDAEKNYRAALGR